MMDEWSLATADLVSLACAAFEAVLGEEGFALIARTFQGFIGNKREEEKMQVLRGRRWGRQEARMRKGLRLLLVLADLQRTLQYAGAC